MLRVNYKTIFIVTTFLYVYPHFWFNNKADILCDIYTLYCSVTVVLDSAKINQYSKVLTRKYLNWVTPCCFLQDFHWISAIKKWLKLKVLVFYWKGGAIFSLYYFVFMNCDKSNMLAIRLFSMLIYGCIYC